jgi:hypothetical protein
MMYANNAGHLALSEIVKATSANGKLSVTADTIRFN